MTGFGKLIRTTAFRLVVTYLVVFVLFAAALLGYIAWNARRVMEGQLVQTIETEINSLAEHYRQGGPRRLANAIERRSREARGFFYLFADGRKQVIAGNAVDIGSVLSHQPGWHEVSYTRSDEDETRRVFARVRLFKLPNDLTLIVGHDLEDRQRMRLVIRQAMTMSLVLVLGSVWAYRAWGTYWQWDPKETAALFTWLVYAVYLHTRTLRGWRGRRSAWILVGAFGAVIFTYFGNYIFGGLHAYGGV